MKTHFWQGFQKQASIMQAVRKGLGTARTFGKGALVGAGVGAAGMGLAQAMGKTQNMQPVQQGY